MKFKTDEKVVFIGENDEGKWKLTKYETYVVVNHAFENLNPITMYCSVSNLKRTKESSWYDEEMFISLKEFRKLKLEKLNNV